MLAADRPSIAVVVFRVAGERYGLPAADVREVLPAASLATPPGNRPGLLGILNLRGLGIPVIDLLALSGSPSGPLRHTDHLLVTCSGGRTIALRADAAETLTTADWDEEASRLVARQWDWLAGVARDAEGLVLIVDPRRLEPIGSSAQEPAAAGAP